MPPNFSGRADERRLLTDWLTQDAAHPLLVIRALGGFGKSALGWHWLTHDIDPAQFPRVVWWSFYEGDASFDSFLRETLEYLGVDPRTLGPRQQADVLLSLLHQPGTLLVLDGFERALRAFSHMNAAYQGDEINPHPQPPAPVRGFSLVGRRESPAPVAERAGDTDCVSPLAEHFLLSLATLPRLQSKVLMTTRLRPRILQTHAGEVLQGCREVELTQMQPADAVTFFRAQGIRGSRAEIEAACSPYGYHPLSLRLLAGLIANDLQQPGDIAAARRLDVAGDLVQRQHHVLEQAYTSLPADCQKLLSQMACFRSPVSYDALKALAEPQAQENAKAQRRKVAKPSTSSASLRLGVFALEDDLRDLIARGLVHHDRATRTAGRYDLHPIVRRYAYDRLTAPDRAAAHAHLRGYFAAVPPKDKVQSLDDLQPVIELYHHTVRAGQYGEAHTLYRDRLANPIYFQFGAYQLEIELLRALFPDGEDKPPRLKTRRDQSWTANALASSCSLSGQPRRAVSLFMVSAELDESENDKGNLAVDLGNVAIQQLVIGALRAAEANLRRSIALCREIRDEFWEAVGHRELGRLLAYRGVWAESEQELATALAMFEKQQVVQSQCVVVAYRALRELLLLRWAAVSPHTKYPIPTLRVKSPISHAIRALELADEDARTSYPVERDYVRAHWLLGAAHRVNNDPSTPSAGQGMDEADRHLSEALTRCRNINNVEQDVGFLLDLARLRAAQGNREEALRLAGEALLITERSEYVLQGADVCLFLAQMALDSGDRRAAQAYAKQARRLATCDGPPDYVYKVAYEEAGAMLVKLGERV
jgi:tetratricopeptide (TPR) repeat protein